MSDNFQFDEENVMYAQATLKLNPILRNGAYGIVMRGVQKCTCACASLRDRNYHPLCCIKLDMATDPCMGSGHILVYAFDVLMQIYLSCGYSERSVAMLIIQKNLYGLDIDKRAYQLSYFSLMMKARCYDRRFLDKARDMGVKPSLGHFQGLGGIKDAHLSNYPTIEKFVGQFKDCDTYGSLTEIQAVNGLDEALDDFGGVLNFDIGTCERVMTLYKILSQKYDVVCTNPPYMGGSGMDSKLSDYVKKTYPDSKSDLSTCFMEKCAALCDKNGYYAMINIPVWMFLSSYEKLREKIQINNTYINMLHFGRGVFGSDFGSTSFVISKRRIDNYMGSYRRLFEKQGAVDSVEQKEKWFFEGFGKHIANQDNFSKIPGSPVAYWVSDNFIKTFDNNKIDELGSTNNGFTTGDNDRFLRLWFEVQYYKIGFNIESIEETITMPFKWLPYNKGGAFRKWYGNNDYVINWYNDGFDIKAYGHLVPRSMKYQLKKSISWSKISLSTCSFRIKNKGTMFDVAGLSLFPSNSNYYLYLLALCNTCFVKKCLEILSPTLNYETGHIASLPVNIDSNRKEKIDLLTEENITLSKTDWDSFETSWDFEKHPLLTHTPFSPQQIKKEQDSGFQVMNTMEEAYNRWVRAADERFNKLKANEEELNRIFIDIYGLQDELTPDVEDKDVTVRKADLTRDIKSFVSYAVGCMLGRYSLYKDGLIFAGEPYSLQEFVNKLNDKPGIVSAEEINRAYHNEGVIISEMIFPVEDNIIPITDEEYFSYDIVGRFVDIVREIYGENTLEQNLDFIANALGSKGNTSRQKIRNYFLNDFIKDHNKIYQKRPIYWLYDSGKQHGFKALIYMHRYTADTTGNVRVDYLHKLQRVYESEIARMQEVYDTSTDNREKSNAEKRKDKLAKQLKEARDYDAKISHLALSRIEIDLDDGVKVNYEKVQTGQDGKKLEILAKI